MENVKKQSFEIKGDVNEFFRNLPLLNSTQEQLKVFSDIDSLFKRNQLTIVHKDRGMFKYYNYDYR
jgi:hypothetical protein